MFNWLKKHFIPHTGNDHRPHILRNSNTRSVLVLVVFLEIFSFLLPTLNHLNTTGGMAAVLPAVLSDLTNTERSINNLKSLTINETLNKAAELKAKDMATKGYFAHTSPQGKTPWYWLAQVGYNYQYAGENLAINFSDSKDVANAWMESPTHKANIVKENYTEVGTGIAEGMYEGRETVFVAQVYANPAPINSKQREINKADVKKIEKIVEVVKTEPNNVLGAETVKSIEAGSIIETKAPIQNATFWQKLFASPRNTTNIILYIVFGIIAFTLIIYIFLRMGNHQKDLINNGLIVLAIIGAIFLGNNFLTHKNMIILESLDYSNSSLTN